MLKPDPLEPDPFPTPPEKPFDSDWPDNEEDFTNNVRQ